MNQTLAFPNSTLNYGDTRRGPYSVGTHPFVVTISGIVSPLLVFVTIVTNSFICLVLLKPHMRTPTNTLLVAIAITDVLTGVWPIPCYVFFYTLGGCFEWVPFEWCSIYPILTEYLPTITHTASIWLTVLLAVQRYVCICQFQTGRRCFSKAKVIRAIVLVVAVSILTHVTRFFEETVTPWNVTSRLDPNVTMTSCGMDYAPFVKANIDVYYNIYYWFRVVFINLVPCASLLVLNVLLIMTLRSAQERKLRLLGRQKSDSSSSDGSGQRGQRGALDSTSTTMMLVFVVGLFLLVEFPLAILFIISIVQSTFPVKVMSVSGITMATHSANFAILLSYPINFFIYCSMGRQFRDTFTSMFLRRHRSSNSLSKAQNHTLATEAESRAPYDVRPEVAFQTRC